MDKRYIVDAYCDDCGVDAKLDFTTMKEAEKYAKSLLRADADGLKWDSAAIYDYKTKTCRAVYNGIPETFYNSDVVARSNPRIVWVKT